MLNAVTSTKLYAIRPIVARMTSRYERLREALDGSGKHAAEVAAACGVTPQALSQWLSGTTANPKLEPLFLFADATGYEARWLAIGEGPKKVPRQAREIERLVDQIPTDAQRDAVLGLVRAMAEPAPPPYHTHTETGS